METEDTSLAVYQPSNELPAVRLSEILSKMGLSGERVPASELVDKTFTILRARPFPSRFENQGHAWFCVVLVEGEDEPVTTVLGGTAVVEILDGLANAGVRSPVTVTLRKVEGGRYGEYYILE